MPFAGTVAARAQPRCGEQQRPIWWLMLTGLMLFVLADWFVGCSTWETATTSTATRG